MISNPDLILYACIAKGSIIVAEFSSSKQPGIEEIGKRCIEKTPDHHSIFSHTIRKKTYTFLFHDPFVYFVIFDEDLAKSESFWFLDRVKTSFDELIASNPVEDFDDLCLQSSFYPVYREILAFDSDLVNSFKDVKKDSRNLSMDSRSTGTVSSPLLSKPGMKKKKRPLVCGRGGSEGGGEANGDHQNYNELSGAMMDNKVNHVGENGSNTNNIMMMNKEFSVSMHKNSNGNGFYFGDSRQKAKQIWRKHVWVVLILDLVICAVLFGIWLWVCRGFKCIDG